MSANILSISITMEKHICFVWEARNMYKLFVFTNIDNRLQHWGGLALVNMKESGCMAEELFQYGLVGGSKKFYPKENKI